MYSKKLKIKHILTETTYNKAKPLFTLGYFGMNNSVCQLKIYMYKLKILTLKKTTTRIHSHAYQPPTQYCFDTQKRASHFVNYLQQPRNLLSES